MESPRRLLSDIFQFLGVDDSFKLDISARHNQSGIPRNQSLQDLIRRDLSHWLSVAGKNFEQSTLD